MLHTTRAVVLRTFRHSDHSVILKTYTGAFGARAYLVRTGNRGGVKPAHLQPLDRLELVVTESRERDMHTVREIRVDAPYVGIPTDPVRGLLLLFAQEVFYRTLREESPDPALFNFVLETLEAIDTGKDLGQIPLLLLVRLAGHLGFLPEPALPGEDRFDLREGRFFHGEPEHAHCMDITSSAAFSNLLNAERTGTQASLSSEVRKRLLDELITYYRLHVEGFGQLRSPGVLHAMLL